MNNIDPNLSNKLKIYQRDDATFKRLPVKIRIKKTSIVHETHFTVDTRNGDIYLDCRRRKIFAKQIAFIFARPIHILIKTLWHVTMIGPIYKEIKKSHDKRSWKNIGLSTVDIIRTPLYGAAMTMASIGGVIAGIISPNSLYRSRELVGRLERRLHRVETLKEEINFRMLTPCFSPIENLSTVYLYKAKDDPEDVVENIKSGINRLSYSFILHKQEHRHVFNDCNRLLPEDKSYTSAAVTNTKRLTYIPFLS